MTMKSLMLFAHELAIDWESEKTTIVSFDRLRKLCPCAMCSGETDALGNKYGGGHRPPVENITIVKYERVGHYGLQFFFSDGHKDGIYTFKFLKTL